MNTVFFVMRKILGLSIVFILLIGSCSEPQRSNPLDPKSPYFRPTSTVIFRILSYQNQPLSNVQVFLLNELQNSNNEGIVEFREVLPDTYTVIIRGNHIATDTIHQFVVLPSTTIQRNIFVNRLPIFENVSVYSELLSSGLTNAKCHFSTKVYDLDGRYEIDTVYVNTPFGYIPLLGSLDSTYRFSIDSLPNGMTIHNLVGHLLEFVAIDVRGGRSTAYGTLARVFSGTPFIVAPSNNSTDLVSEFYVEWFAGANDFFSYHFRVIIYHYPSGTELLRYDQIPQTQYRLNLYHVLSAGFYSVEVHEVDSFGNFSRSNRNAFQLVNSTK